MSALRSAARTRGQVAKPSRGPGLPVRPRVVIAETGSNLAKDAGWSRVDLGAVTRVAFMITPRGQGALREQVGEVLSAVRAVLDRHPEPMTMTLQTVFLKDARHQAECERLFAEFSGSERPVTNYVLQPPCGGAALALEAWAIGGKSVEVEHFGSHALAVAYDGVRWVYCAGVKPAASLRGVYPQALDALGRMRAALEGAGSSFDRVVRTWFYLGGITETEAGVQRYEELNRARTDFYRDIRFHCSSLASSPTQGIYPASTGIGRAGRGLVTSCMTLQTRRADVFLVPLENPQQTPAYSYDSRHSSQSPKFSRAVALGLGDYVTTWVSGTASIVQADSRHPGDPVKQTEQTIDNIERLIGAENFARHGLKGAGAKLNDLAKIRVYLKRPEDLAKCRAVCERRFGSVPAIYAVAGICRPELLVEVEGVAFSRYSPAEA